MIPHFISAQNIFFRYEGQSSWALQDATLSCSRGDCVVIEGPAGCGKTTLLKALTGHLHPQRGQFLCRRYPSTLPSSAFGIMPQALTVVPMLSVLENSILPFMALNRQIQERDIRFCNRLLQALGLGPHRHEDVKTLSHQQQRVLMFVRALVHRPPIVILDDPFLGLEADLRLLMMRIIIEFCREGMTMIMTLGAEEAWLSGGLADPMFCRYVMKDGHLTPHFTEGFARTFA